MVSKSDLVKLGPYLYEIPTSYRADMRVPARFYASHELLEKALQDRSLEQLVNTATLPGVVKWALAMPDIHQGYGFPIGGVVATKLPNGIISPGGVGYDINCGVRLLASELVEEEVRPHLETLASTLYHYVPSGVGVKGFVKLTDKDLDRVMVEGARWALDKGYARPEDLRHTEEGGAMPGADPSKVSKKARERGREQIGTLGAGNHFCEVDVVDEVFDEEVAQAFGLWPGQVVVQIHCGSRGFGHQICTDYVQLFQKAIHKYGIVLPDRELVCAPFDTPEGQSYFAAMVAAANFAWTNRQLLTHQVREAFAEALGSKVENTDLRVVYDVAHNIAKRETHDINGKKVEVLVHRKGATRSFPPGHHAVPEDYRPYGQPVLVPGSMGTASWVLVGTPSAMEETFGSSCHGAGRMMSRRAATKKVHGRELIQELGQHGIVVRAGSMRGVAEEAPFAYKDVDVVVEVVQGAGIARKVARLRPIAVVKG